MKKTQLIIGFISLAAAFVLSGCKDGPEPVAPTVETVSSVTEITATTATSGGEVTIDGDAAVTSRGVCWGTASGPTTAGNKTTDGEGLGTFTSRLTGLTPGTMYYLRAYAVNSAGTGYGDQVTFTTSGIEAAVSTAEASLITPTSAQSGGNIADDGGAEISERGVCWAAQPSPTIDGSKATAGMGTGEFTAKLTGLSPSTTYYVRAYAINSAGTAYGNEITFTTLSGESNITTAEAGSITATSARSGGEVADDGGAAVIARGVCWATSPNPTIDGNNTTNGSGIGGFESRITGLIPATTYYLRAYATGKTGTEYGNEVTFTTLSGEAAITTVEADNIGGTSARSGGNVSDDGGSAIMVKGVCWSKSKNPTIADGKTVNGPGTGDFLNDLTGLTPVTAYYARAYATNELGDTYYGNEVTFTTTDPLLSLTPGTLQDAVEASGLEDAASLTLRGTIDQRDFAYMKDMVDNRSLRDIDLSGVTVAAYGRYPANGIPASAFYNSALLASFVFPAEITSIGERAFYSCKGLTGSLAIPDGVTAIGSSAFEYCSGFTGSLTISDSVTSIGNSAFRYCSGLTGSLVIPGGVTEIANKAFAYCKSLTGSLVIPDGVTSIGEYAFFYCSGLTGSLTIPINVTSIAGYAFYNCKSLTGALVIPDNVTSIGNAVFSGCSGFTGSLVIPGSITSIGNSVFYNCSGFNGSLTIPDSITTIGTHAFYKCSGFTGSLVIPESVTSIGGNAFLGCNGFEGSLTISSNITSFEVNTFKNCSGFTGSLIIPDSVTLIGESAFYGCSGFTGSLAIPDNVKTIDYCAFYECSGFDGSLTIGDNVKTIVKAAFYGCSGFTGSLTIPGSVTSIGDYVFYNCRNFTGSLVIPGSVISIGSSAFRACKGLDGSLTISDSVTSIGSSAFYECGALSDIKVAWETPITYEQDMLPSAKTVNVPSASVSLYEAADGWKDHPITGY